MSAAPHFRRLAVLGVGLLGGSFALAARRAGLVDQVCGYSATPATLQTALQMQVIDTAAASAAAAVVDADLVLLAVPVAATATLLEAIRAALAPDALLLDVGSTKVDVVAAAARLGQQRCRFVPSHPIAGAERSGVQYADAALFQGRRAVLTPLAENTEATLAQAAAVWQALGCQVMRMDPQQHDDSFAAVSHLPHLLAFAYIGGLLQQKGGSARMALGGSGFRDFSRIAGGDPVMWRDVLLANAAPVLRQLDHFQTALQQLQDLIRSGRSDALGRALDPISQARRAWDQPDSDPETDEPV